MKHEPHALPIKEPVAYQLYCDLHHDSTGSICISQIQEGKCQDHYGRYQAMLDYMQSLENQAKIFFSINTFEEFIRSTEHICELKALYIDLDFHKNTNPTREQILDGINQSIKDGKIPKPTHIIDSGYEINLIWRIKRATAQDLPLWQTVEQYLCEQLKHLGADSKALNGTKIFPVRSTNKITIMDSSQSEYDLRLLYHTITQCEPYSNSLPSQ